jgi:hypothetical protein
MPPLSKEKKAKLENNLLVYNSALDYVESRIRIIEKFSVVTINAGNLFLEQCIRNSNEPFDRSSIVITGDDFFTCLNLLEKQIFCLQRRRHEYADDPNVLRIYKILEEQVKDLDFLKFAGMCNIEGILNQIRKKNVSEKN